MRALVTGGTGFIGANLARRLRSEGHVVFVSGTPGKESPEFRGQVLPREFWTLDWELLGPLDVLFHQAAINDTTLRDRETMFRVNVEAALYLFAQAVAQGCRRIVYASSCSVYGDLPPPFREEGPVRPLNVYAESKVALDERAMTFARENPGTTLVGLRYSNVYGRGERAKGKRATMITQFADQMREGNPRLFQWGDQKRDYVYVEDAARANLLAAEATASTVVNCGSGSATSFNELIALLNEVLGLERTPKYIANPYDGAYQNFTLCDLRRAREILRFVPAFDMRTGLRAYAATGELAPWAGEAARLRVAPPSASLARRTDLPR